VPMAPVKPQGLELKARAWLRKAKTPGLSSDASESSQGQSQVLSTHITVLELSYENPDADCDRDQSRHRPYCALEQQALDISRYAARTKQGKEYAEQASLQGLLAYRVIVNRSTGPRPGLRSVCHFRLFTP
jgi:hypothetical protein